jgi:membrane associated rhomboid family serine protease
MQQSGFRSSPLTKRLLYSILTLSILSTITASKPLFHIQLVPHILNQHQLYRIPAFQFLYANSGELLFATILLYHLRVVERIFGSRKFLSLVLYLWGVTSIVAPALLLVGYVSTRGGRWWNYLPPGPTPLLFGLLAQYHAAVPSTYKFTVVLPGDAGEVALTDKWYLYLIAVQLGACQLPSSALLAAVGWVVGYAWRLDLLPAARWRVPGRVVVMLGGESGGSEYDGLRRRLTGEPEQRRDEPARPIVWRVVDQFRGSF